MEHQTSVTVAQTRETVKILKVLSRERIQFMGGGAVTVLVLPLTHPPKHTYTNTKTKKTFLKWDSQTKMFNVHNT